MTKYISLVQSKGGSGKSTITCLLASSLSTRGKKTLVIDADCPQSTSYSWGISYIEQHENKNIEFQKAETPEALAKLAEEANEKFEVVIMDLPPRDRIYMNTAMGFSDIAITPLRPNISEAWATEDIVKLITSCLKDNELLTHRILWNQMQSSNKGMQIFIDEFMLAYPTLEAFKTQIGRRVAHEIGVGTNALDSKNKKALEETNDLVAEVLEMLER